MRSFDEHWILNLNVIKVLNLYGLYFWRPKKSFSCGKYLLLNCLAIRSWISIPHGIDFFKVWSRIRCLIFPYEYPFVLDTINAAPQFTQIHFAWSPQLIALGELLMALWQLELLLRLPALPFVSTFPIESDHGSAAAITLVATGVPVDLAPRPNPNGLIESLASPATAPL